MIFWQVQTALTAPDHLIKQPNMALWLNCVRGLVGGRPDVLLLLSLTHPIVDCTSSNSEILNQEKLPPGGGAACTVRTGLNIALAQLGT